MLVLTVLLGGCGVMNVEGRNVAGRSVDEQWATLRQRPDIAQISIRYERMQAELRDRLSTDIGGLTWVNDNNEEHGGCGFEFPGVPEGQSRSLARWVGRGNIPDARWNDAVAIVREITRKYGFSTPEVLVNRPADHEIVVPDPYGGTFNFGTAVNTILSMHTGCHLPAK